MNITFELSEHSESHLLFTLLLGIASLFKFRRILVFLNESLLVQAELLIEYLFVVVDNLGSLAMRGDEAPEDL